MADISVMIETPKRVTSKDLLHIIDGAGYVTTRQPIPIARDPPVVICGKPELETFLYTVRGEKDRYGDLTRAANNAGYYVWRGVTVDGPTCPIASLNETCK